MRRFGCAKSGPLAGGLRENGQPGGPETFTPDSAVCFPAPGRQSRSDRAIFTKPTALFPTRYVRAPAHFQFVTLPAGRGRGPRRPASRRSTDASADLGPSTFSARPTSRGFGEIEKCREIQAKMRHIFPSKIVCRERRHLRERRSQSDTGRLRLAPSAHRSSSRPTRLALARTHAHTRTRRKFRKFSFRFLSNFPIALEQRSHGRHGSSRHRVAGALHSGEEGRQGRGRRQEAQGEAHPPQDLGDGEQRDQGAEGARRILPAGHQEVHHRQLQGRRRQAGALHQEVPEGGRGVGRPRPDQGQGSVRLLQTGGRQEGQVGGSGGRLRVRKEARRQEVQARGRLQGQEVRRGRRRRRRSRRQVVRGGQEEARQRQEVAFRPARGRPQVRRLQEGVARRLQEGRSRQEGRQAQDPDQGEEVRQAAHQEAEGAQAQEGRRGSQEARRQESRSQEVSERDDDDGDDDKRGRGRKARAALGGEHVTRLRWRYMTTPMYVHACIYYHDRVATAAMMMMMMIIIIIIIIIIIVIVVIAPHESSPLRRRDARIINTQTTKALFRATTGFASKDHVVIAISTLTLTLTLYIIIYI